MIPTFRNAPALQLWPLILGFAVLAIVVLGRSWFIEDQQVENAAVRRAFEAERQILATLSLVQDAESGQRGFVLTGEDPYLDPYRVAIDALPDALESVRTLVEANGPRMMQFGGLRAAIDAKLVEMDTTISLRRAGKVGDAVSVIKSDGGKMLMDDIRKIVDDMLFAENAELELRLSRAASLENWLSWASLATLVGVFGVAAYTIWDSRRRLRDLALAHGQLAQSNEALRAEIDMREKSEAQTRQLQKMEAIGQLTGGIAHDFNNMLAVIMSAMNLAQRKLARGETDIHQFVEAASEAAGRAASLTQRLLAFSRQQPLAPGVVDANRLVAGMSDLLTRTLGELISVETVLAGGLWKTHADPSQVENAILNLTVNARDAMPDGGKLTIETANSYLDDAYASTHAEVAPGQYVMVAVTDTGSGMPPEVAAKAFDPFFTTKPVSKGTGLGLSQVFGFVKQSNGHVKIYSEPGSGTTVKIYLPRHFGEDNEETAPRTSVDTAKAPSETILVVEDDLRVRNSTVAALRDLGYTVIHAGDADEAIKKLEDAPYVALIFTDIVMPGKSGRKLADEALQRFPHLKIVYTTGFTRNAVVHNGVLDHGVNFLAKPFTIDQLATKLREVLG